MGMRLHMGAGTEETASHTEPSRCQYIDHPTGIQCGWPKHEPGNTHLIEGRTKPPDDPRAEDGRTKAERIAAVWWEVVDWVRLITMLALTIGGVWYAWDGRYSFASWLVSSATLVKVSGTPWDRRSDD